METQEGENSRNICDLETAEIDLLGGKPCSGRTILDDNNPLEPW